MNTYFNIDYENFQPIIGRSIKMPNNILLYRAYDINFDIISERSLFFGDYDTAYSYYKRDTMNRRFGIFSSNNQLKLIDIRYMIIILNEFIKSITLKDIKNPTLLKIINCLTISFGLTDYEIQLQLIKHYLLLNADNDMKSIINNMDILLQKFNNSSITEHTPYLGIYRLNGFRFGETNTDEFSVSVLKLIFENVCDGFISPRLWTPMNYKTNYNMHHEICIFNPLKSLIIKLPDIFPKNSHSYNYNINDILKSNYRNYITETTKNYNNLFIKLHNFKGGKNTIDNNDSMFIRNKAIMNNKNYKKREDKLKNILKNPRYKIILPN